MSTYAKYIDVFSDLSLEDALNLKNEGYRIIFVDKDPNEGMGYLIDDFIKIKQTIKKIKEDVPNIPVDDPDREKKIFSYVYTRLAYMINYDTFALERSNVTGYQREMLEDRLAEARSMHGLIRRISLCSGYSNILLTVLNEFNIEATYVRGGPKTRGEAKLMPNGSHAWNQVKLDNKWYNCDLTNDHDFILAGLKLPLFLKSNADFNRYEKYPVSEPYNQCDTSLSDQEQEKLISDSIAYVEQIRLRDEQIRKEQEEQKRIEAIKNGPFINKLIYFFKTKFAKKVDKENTTRK